MEHTVWHALGILGHVLWFLLALAELVTVGSLVVVLVGVPIFCVVYFWWGILTAPFRSS